MSHMRGFSLFLALALASFACAQDLEVRYSAPGLFDGFVQLVGSTWSSFGPLRLVEGSGNVTATEGSRMALLVNDASPAGISDLEDYAGMAFDWSDIGNNAGIMDQDVALGLATRVCFDYRALVNPDSSASMFVGLRDTADGTQNVFEDPISFDSFVRQFAWFEGFALASSWKTYCTQPAPRTSTYRLVIALAQSSLSGSVAGVLVDNVRMGSFPTVNCPNGHTYGLVATASNSRVTKDQASDAAASMGWYLATLTTMEEYTCVDQLLDLRRRMGETKSRFWLGASRGELDAFCWDNGETFSCLQNWAPGEPNNQNGDEDCLEVFADGNWNDIECDESRIRHDGFIIEQGAHLNCPVLFFDRK